MAKLLDFPAVAANSVDAVSDRDFAVEFLAAGAILAMHFSRLAEELVLWASAEFAFIELPDAFATGSSIMPQKKNPDVAELSRGKTGRVYGALMSLLTILKGLPLSYNRDLQEDKEPLFDAVDTLRQILDVVPPMLAAVTFRTDRMRAAAGEGFLNATDLADYLVTKGVAFREAHEIVGKLVRACIASGEHLESLPLARLPPVLPGFRGGREPLYQPRGLCGAAAVGGRDQLSSGGRGYSSGQAIPSPGHEEDDVFFGFGDRPGWSCFSYPRSPPADARGSRWPPQEVLPAAVGGLRAEPQGGGHPAELDSARPQYRRLATHRPDGVSHLAGWRRAGCGTGL